MPRRHPKPEKHNQGPSPATLAARRQRRLKRRETKSPPLPQGILTFEERLGLLRLRSELRRQLRRHGRSQRLREQLANVERELRADSAAGGDPQRHP